jgi:putative ATPase
MHLRSTGYAGAEKLGHGADYDYAHNHPEHVVDQQYFPDEVSPAPFYRPSDQGREVGIAERMRWLDSIFKRSGRN